MRKPSQKQANKTRQLRFEGLESRELMAGNVWAGVSGGVLVINGDNASNGVEIRAGNAAGEFIVNTDGRLNGQSREMKFSGVKQGIQVLLHGGNDWLRVDSYNGRATTINGSFGLGIDMGAGNDTVMLQNVRVGGSCGISGQAGSDGVDVQNSFFGQDLIIDTAGGNDRVSVFKSTAARYLNVGTGDNDDTVTLNQAAAAWIYCHLGSGNDDIGVRDSWSALTPGFDGGPGRDWNRGMPGNHFPAPPNCINFE